MMTKMLTKQDIIKCTDIETREVAVPEWGGSVLLRSMTGEERDEWEQGNQMRNKGEGQPVNVRGFKVDLLARVIRDPENPLKPLFDKKDLIELNKKNAKPISDLFAVACKMNGIGDDQVKQMEKNSQAAVGIENG